MTGDRPAPLGLPPPYGVHPRNQESLPARDRLASQPEGLSPDPLAAAFHGLPVTQAAPLSQEEPPITRFFAVAWLLRSSDLRCGLIRLRLIRLASSVSSQTRTSLFAPRRPPCRSRKNQPSRRLARATSVISLGPVPFVQPSALLMRRPGGLNEPDCVSVK